MTPWSFSGGPPHRVRDRPRSDRALSPGFGLVGMPSAYLIDADGRVRAVTRGFRAGEAKALRARIETLLTECRRMPAVAPDPALERVGRSSFRAAAVIAPSSRGERRWARERGCARRPPRSPSLFLSSCGLLACQSVEPWQREQLSTPRMQREPHGPHAAFLDHVRQSREAATTGSRVGRRGLWLLLGPSARGCAGSARPLRPAPPRRAPRRPRRARRAATAAVAERESCVP